MTTLQFCHRHCGPKGASDLRAWSARFCTVLPAYSLSYQQHGGRRAAGSAQAKHAQSLLTAQHSDVIDEVLAAHPTVLDEDARLTDKLTALPVTPMPQLRCTTSVRALPGGGASAKTQMRAFAQIGWPGSTLAQARTCCT